MPLFSSHRPSRHLRAATAQPIAPPPAAGAGATALLKRYRPLETRAAGGFGSVEICLDARLQRRVAIKRMPLTAPDIAAPQSHETVATALAEARTAGLLQHPNIVSVIDFTYDAAYAYLVMEYVDGMSLEEFLAQVDGHSLTYDEAAAVTDALTQALAYAHENGVLHLDIKPANVLIDHSGHVKLTDFGMAMLTSAAGFGGARGGTIGYMPPEQLRGELVDERTDAFALAAVLYEALCGTAPFRAGTPQDSLARIERGVIYPSKLLPDIPALSEETLLDALAADPADRPADVAAMGERLCAQLGNAKEGRRSLARLVARLTSDEDADPTAAGDSAPVPDAPRATVETDPALGYLGSRYPHARRIALGTLSGIAVTASVYAIASAMGIAGAPARIAVALAVGAAAGIAPQIGSALVVSGLLLMVLNATELLAALVPTALICALATGWWYVWGRTTAAASTAFVLALAGTCLPGGTGLVTPCAAALAAYFLPADAAAASVGLGTLTAALFRAALTAGGSLPLLSAAEALAALAPWVYTLGGGLIAALTSRALAYGWQHVQDGGSTAAPYLAALIPLACTLPLPWLAAPMEISPFSAPGVAYAAGVGGLSSILLAICAYLLGLNKDHVEGDCS